MPKRFMIIDFSRMMRGLSGVSRSARLIAWSAPLSSPKSRHCSATSSNSSDCGLPVEAVIGSAADLVGTGGGVPTGEADRWGEGKVCGATGLAIVAVPGNGMDGGGTAEPAEGGSGLVN